MLHAISLGIVIFVAIIFSVIIVVMGLFEYHSSELEFRDWEPGEIDKYLLEDNEEDNVIFKA